MLKTRVLKLSIGGESREEVLENGIALQEHNISP